VSVSQRDVQVSGYTDVNERIQSWICSFRIKFLPQGVLPVLLGSLVAWIEHNQFDLTVFILAFVGSALVQIALTMLNDVLDYIYGTDRTVTPKKNPFTGGSGVLADNILQPAEMLLVVAAFYAIAASIGAYLMLNAGADLMGIILLGLFLSVFYSLKPLRLAFRGLGELAMLIGYGPTITLGAYYVQTGTFSPLAALAGMVPGLLMWSMILVNEIPDYLEDVSVAKLNLTVRLGPERVRWIYIISLTGVYFYILGGVVLHTFPPLTLLALGSLPFALKSFWTVYHFYLDQRAMIPANRSMVITYSTTMVLYCLGFLLSKLL
jgi:1,4-dihydroxy-2-naphthoate octaprenyltransferase